MKRDAITGAVRVKRSLTYIQSQREDLTRTLDVSLGMTMNERHGMSTVYKIISTTCKTGGDRLQHNHRMEKSESKDSTVFTTATGGLAS